MLTALHVLAALGEQDRPLSELVADYSRYAASGEINSQVTDVPGTLDKVEAAYHAPGDATADRLDGLTVTFTDGRWFNRRPSNTEPLLRLNVEGPTTESMTTLRDEVLGLVRWTTVPVLSRPGPAEQHHARTVPLPGSPGRGTGEPASQQPRRGRGGAIRLPGQVRQHQVPRICPSVTTRRTLRDPLPTSAPQHSTGPRRRPRSPSSRSRRWSRPCRSTAVARWHGWAGPRKPEAEAARDRTAEYLLAARLEQLREQAAARRFEVLEDAQARPRRDAGRRAGRRP
ncbi:hypothetical protein ADL21_09210 [Streptomyces albus subsp. albus]|nr:hypothetical protein ADL21_09210 [Streptomyces albus subsp. albus]